MPAEKGPGEDPLKGGIKWKSRDPMGSFQMGCGFLGFVLIFLQVIVSFILMGSTNGYIDFHSEGSCLEGYTMHMGYLCVRQEVTEEYKQLKCPGGGGVYDFHFQYDDDFDGRRRLYSGEGFDAKKGGAMWDNDLFGERELGEDIVMRRLSEQNSYSIWDRMSQNAEVPGVLVPLLLIVGFLWILLLQKAAGPCIWGAIVFSVLICIFLAIFPMLITVHVCVTKGGSVYPLGKDKASDDWCRFVEGGRPDDRSGELCWVFIIPAVVIILLSYYYRESIRVAALCLSKCCSALQQEPMIIVSSLGVFSTFLIYQGLWIGAILAIPEIWEATCPDFGGSPQITVKDNTDLIQLLSILLLPSYIFFEMMIIVVVSCGVGGWYFKGNPETPMRPSVEGLKWAYTTSSGAVFCATIISWPIVWIRDYIHGKWAKFALCPCLPCSWVYYILYILWCCVLRAYMAFTRFMLISHTFHGGDIFKVARSAWAVLKKHLGGAVVTDSVASLVLDMGVNVISISFAIGAWAWMEKAIGKGFLSDLFSGADATGSMIGVITLLLVLMWFCQHSLFTIIVVALTATIVKDTPQIHGFICGLFTGAVCNVIFSFLAKVIHAGMDTIFYCFALEAEYATGYTREGVTEIGDMIKQNVVQPLPEFLEEEKGATPSAPVVVKTV